MGKDLLAFLFGESQVDEEIAGIVESIADLNADDGADLKVDKQPLAKALSALGIETKGLENDPRGLSLVFADGEECRAAHAILNEPENLHKLAQLGWVFSVQGDVAMTREPSEHRIRFLEIDDVELSKEEPKPTKGDEENSKIAAVIKKGRKFATTEPDFDDDMNPVSHAHPKDGGHDKGVGKEAHGSHPEGDPKTGLSKSASHSTPSKGDLTQPEEGAQPQGKLKEARSKPGPHCLHCGSTAHKTANCPTGFVGRSKPRDKSVKENEGSVLHAPGCKCEECVAKEGRNANPVAEGKHKSGCGCGFCKNKGNIHKRGDRPHDDEDSQETTDTGTDFKGESAVELVNAMLEGNPGTPPGITGHKSYPGMKVGSPDRKFRPAKGMVQPDNPIVNQQAKRKVKSV